MRRTFALAFRDINRILEIIRTPREMKTILWTSLSEYFWCYRDSGKVQNKVNWRGQTIQECRFTKMLTNFLLNLELSASTDHLFLKGIARAQYEFIMCLVLG